MCYVEVAGDGTVTFGRDSGTYQRACSGELRLFAAWPGQWSSHLFVIDDLDEYERAFGIVHDEKRTGLADHEHQVRWDIDPYEENPNGTYVTIELRFDCGCELRELQTLPGRCANREAGMSPPQGDGGSQGADEDRRTYLMRVRRTSL